MLRPCKGRPFRYLQGFESMARPFYCPFPLSISIALSPSWVRYGRNSIHLKLASKTIIRYVVGTRSGVGWMRGPCACPRPVGLPVNGPDEHRHYSTGSPAPGRTSTGPPASTPHHPLSLPSGQV